LNMGMVDDLHQKAQKPALARKYEVEF
jgi:hypothetical protein